MPEDIVSALFARRPLPGPDPSGEAEVARLKEEIARLNQMFSAQMAANNALQVQAQTAQNELNKERDARRSAEARATEAQEQSARKDGEIARLQEKNRALESSLSEAKKDVEKAREETRQQRIAAANASQGFTPFTMEVERDSKGRPERYVIQPMGA